jgi:hypothetical protein
LDSTAFASFPPPPPPPPLVDEGAAAPDDEAPPPVLPPAAVLLPAAVVLPPPAALVVLLLPVPPDSELHAARNPGPMRSAPPPTKDSLSSPRRDSWRCSPSGGGGDGLFEWFSDMAVLSWWGEQGRRG